MAEKRTRKPQEAEDPKDPEAPLDDAAVVTVEEVEHPDSIHLKLSRIMGKIGHVEKKGHNDHFNYDYVKESDLVDAIRGLLAEEGIFIYSSILHSEEREVFGTAQNGAQVSKGHVTKVVIGHTFADGETGQTFTVKSQGAGHDALDKGLYKAITGAEKYFLMKNFLVATGLEPEEDAAPKEPAQQRASTRSTKSTTAKKDDKKGDAKKDEPAVDSNIPEGQRPVSPNTIRRIQAMARTLKIDDPKDKAAPNLHRIVGVGSLKELTNEQGAIWVARLQEAFGSSEALDKLKGEGGDAAAGQPTGASPPSRETSPPSSPTETETADATPVEAGSPVEDETPAQEISEPIDESEQAEAELARQDSEPPPAAEDEGANEAQWERGVALFGSMDKLLAAIKERFPTLEAPGLVNKAQFAQLMFEKMGGTTATDIPAGGSPNG